MVEDRVGLRDVSLLNQRLLDVEIEGPDQPYGVELGREAQSCVPCFRIRLIRASRRAGGSYCRPAATAVLLAALGAKFVVFIGLWLIGASVGPASNDRFRIRARRTIRRSF
jgi:hypothetical protein